MSNSSLRIFIYAAIASAINETCNLHFANSLFVDFRL